MNRKLVSISAAIVVAACSLSAAHATPITSSADPALTGSTLVDYNSEAQGSFSSRVIGGVTISGIGGNLSISNDANGQYVPPVDQFLDNRYGGIGFNFTFSSSVSAFGMQVGATNSTQSLTAYDISNNVLETLTIPDQVGSLPYPYTGFYGIAHAGIAYVTLTGNAGDWIVTDDLRYVSAPSSVPEPEVLSLFALGLLGVGLIRRRAA